MVTKHTNKKDLIIQFSATAVSTKTGQQYTIQKELVGSIEYTTLEDLVREYTSLRESVNDLVETTYIKEFEPESTTKDVYVIFNMFEYIYDSERDGVLPRTVQKEKESNGSNNV